MSIKGWELPWGSTIITENLSVGKTVGGAGRLTDAVIDNGYAIRDTKNTTNDIWATYYHMTCGPKKETLEEQLGFGPKGQSATWRKYHEDKTKYNCKKCSYFVLN